MVITGHLILPDGAGRIRLAPGSLIVDGGRIVEVSEGSLNASADIGGDDYIISPGFIDTHMHLPQIYKIF